jgi:cysteinyl-tRNA synthetase
MLQANYKSILDFSDAALLASEKGFYKLMEAVSNLEGISVSNNSSIDIASWKGKCYEAMNDDFNTPILIANLFEGAKFVNLLKEGIQTISRDDLEVLKLTMNNFVFDVLGLKNTTETNSGEDKLSGVVEMLIGMRKNARDNKNWALSDQIRDELLALGIQLKDGKDGTTFSVN